MPQTLITRQNDMLDALLAAKLGNERRTTEAVLAANPGLAALGPVMPIALHVLVPDFAPQPSRRLDTVNLWG